MKINWRIRFDKRNIMFYIRFMGALLIPVLTYMGLSFEDFTTWKIVWVTFLEFLSNPVLVILTFINALNIVPDSTTPGLNDSERALKYKTPGGW